MAEETDILSETEPKRHFLLVDLVIRLVKEKPLGTIGGVIVLIMFFTGIFADLGWLGLPDVGLAPERYDEVHPADFLSPPSAQYILGTDILGRDMLSRIIYGARISMIVGLAGASLAVLVATIIGTLSGFIGGKFDMVVQRFVDAMMCFPSLFLYLTIMTLLGRGLLQVIMVIGVIRGIRNSRVVRSAVISIKENVYVEAATAIGAPTRRILTRHIVPNIMAPIIIIFTITMGSMILDEAYISFLGFGIPPPIPSWGAMLSGQGRQYMIFAPWLAVWPGLALSIVIYGINMLGDGVRDILDPRLRGGLGRYGRTTRKRRQGKKSK